MNPLKRRRRRPQDANAARRDRLLVRKYERFADEWEKNAPIFTIPGVSLATLKSRPKPCKNDREAAAQKMETMANWPSDPFSGIFQDKDGRRLVAVFATQPIRATEALESPLTPLEELEPVEEPESPLTPLEDLSSSDEFEYEADSQYESTDDMSDYESNDEVPVLGGDDDLEDGKPDAEFDQEDLDLAKVPILKDTIPVSHQLFTILRLLIVRVST